ncbi:hypothetical protein KAU18_10715 [Candidatus Bathyarchaeota archaeon]|nr:hypothetical protein [Candidatus Bathyarchaeota archaeon]
MTTDEQSSQNEKSLPSLGSKLIKRRAQVSDVFSLIEDRNWVRVRLLACSLFSSFGLVFFPKSLTLFVLVGA